MLLRGHISLGSSPSPDALNCQVYASVGMSADDGALVSDLSAHDYSLGQHALPLIRPSSADIWTRGVHNHYPSIRVQVSPTCGGGPGLRQCPRAHGVSRIACHGTVSPTSIRLFGLVLWFILSARANYQFSDGSVSNSLFTRLWRRSAYRILFPKGSTWTMLVIHTRIACHGIMGSICVSPLWSLLTTPK